MKQLNLGELIYELEKYDPEKNISFDFGSFVPDELRSYRGYYEQLALGFQEEKQMTVGELLTECKSALGTVFMGYKGGNYVMRSRTPLWAANWGRSTETAIVGVTDYGDWIIINTAHIET